MVVWLFRCFRFGWAVILFEDTRGTVWKGCLINISVTGCSIIFKMAWNWSYDVVWYSSIGTCVTNTFTKRTSNNRAWNVELGRQTRLTVHERRNWSSRFSLFTIHHRTIENGKRTTDTRLYLKLLFNFISTYRRFVQYNRVLSVKSPSENNASLSCLYVKNEIDRMNIVILDYYEFCSSNERSGSFNLVNSLFRNIPEEDRDTKSKSSVDEIHACDTAINLLNSKWTIQRNPTITITHE